jgi:hypothetical protein
MKLNLSLFISLVLVSFSIVSCKTNFNAQVYRFVPSIASDIQSENEIRKRIAESDVKGINLKNDSILEYWKRYGGLASLTTIKYTLVNDELIVYPTDIKGHDVPDVSNVHFLYGLDSLVNKKTNEKYYNQKYLNRISKK